MTGGQGDTVGPYVLEEQIGSGGMGVVWRARERNGTRKIALKILKGEVPPSIVLRFEREAAIRIEHPNVARVLDSGIDERGTRFIALELLEGETMAARLRRGRATAKECVEAGVQVCRGLASAHELGVVHRDLKPSNIFCSKDGTVKVLDFGVAHLLDAEDDLTPTGSVVGTTSYLSPEQARGEPDIDGRSDVWALGAVLYESLSGRAPFRRETPVATMLAVILDPLVPLHGAAAGVPGDLARAVEGALVKAREQRWQSAAHFESLLLDADLSPGPERRATSREETIPLGETRVVAVVLAEDVRDLDGFSSAVEARAGHVIPLRGRRAIGLFGGESWEGDEVVRAALAAHSGRGAAGSVAVACGRATRSGTSISGAALRAAELGCGLRHPGIVLSAESARLLAGEAVLKPIGEQATAAFFELVRVRRSLPRSSDTVHGSALHGREVELAEVDRALDAFIAEQEATTLLITGAPGIGKTRLRQEIERRVLQRFRRPAIVLKGRAESHRRESSFALIASALQGFVASESDQPSAATLEGPTLDELPKDVFQLIDCAMNEKDRSACALYVGRLLGVRSKRSAISDALNDPQLMADRMRVAILDMFEAVLARFPLILILEDLHWADAESLEIVEELVERASGTTLGDESFLDDPTKVDRPVRLITVAQSATSARCSSSASGPALRTARDELPLSTPSLFAVLTARSEFLEGKADRLRSAGAIHIEPRRLTLVDVRKVSEGIFGRPLPDPILRAITERTGGNPLFVEQIVLELADRGVSEDSIDKLPLPLTVEAAVQSRLDHLPRAEKELLKRAAVLNRAFTSEEIRGLGVVDAEGLLTALVRREVLTARSQTKADRRRVYAFRSTLVADVAYRMLSPELAKELHGKASEFLRHVSRINAEELAIHYDRSDATKRAARRYVAATFAALRRGDGKTLLRCSERALEIGVRPLARFQMHMARSDALKFLGRRAEQGAELDAALQVAMTDAQKARAFSERSWWLTRTGQSSKALPASTAAIEAARASNDREVLALALGQRTLVSLYLNLMDAAVEAFTEAYQLAQSGSSHLRALAAGWRAQLLSALGDLGGRLDAWRSAAALYNEAGDMRRAAAAETNLADAYNRFGAYEEARSALEAALAACRRVGHRTMEGYALLNLGYSLSMLGRAELALEALQQAKQIASITREDRLAVSADIYRARARLNGEAADAVALEAGEIAQRANLLGFRDLFALSLSIAARAHLMAGHAPEAIEVAEAALRERARLGGVQEDEAELFLTHARALHAAGRLDEATRAIEHGREALKAVAGGVSDLSWRRRLLEDVTAHRDLMRALA
jgi:tetratricopeptide (TPR) repeat protein